MSPSIPDQPNRERRRFERHVYVVEFDNGRIKVGQTSDPDKRLSEHRGMAHQFGSDITRFWVSQAHTGFALNEESLIRYCRNHGTSSSGREYFADLDFYQVAAYAESLPFETLTDEEVAEKTASSGPSDRERRAAQLDAFERRTPQRSVASLTDDEMARIRAAFGGGLAVWPRDGAE